MNKEIEKGMKKLYNSKRNSIIDSWYVVYYGDYVVDVLDSDYNIKDWVKENGNSFKKNGSSKKRKYVNCGGIRFDDDGGDGVGSSVGNNVGSSIGSSSELARNYGDGDDGGMIYCWAIRSLYAFTNISI